MNFNLKDYENDEAYLIKIGALPINRFSDKDTKISSDKIFLANLEKVLNKSESVVKWEKIKRDEDIAEDLHITFNIENKRIFSDFFNFFYKLKIKIPKKRIKNEFFGRLKKEEFLDLNNNIEVLYDGFSYLYFKKINLKKSFFLGGVSGREELDTILGKVGKIGSCAPNPLREECIVIVTNRKLPKNIEYFDFNKIDYRIFCFLPKNKKISSNDYFSHVFRVDSSCLQYFYKAEFTNSLLNTGKQEIFKLNSIVFNEIIKEKKINFKYIENLCSKIQLHISRYLENKIKFKEEKEFFERSLNDTIFLKSIKDILKKELDGGSFDLRGITQQLNYVDRIVERKSKLKQWLVTIFISLITSITTLFVGLKILK